MKNTKAIIIGTFSILFAAGAVFVVGIFGTPTAHAAGCNITAKDIAQITAIQNNTSLSYTDEITAELAVRKQLVAKTIVCAQKEAQTFQTNLASTTVESDAQPLQSQLLGDLTQAAEFYNTELAKLNVVGIAGTKAIAQEVLSWRQSSFLPLSENVNNFILWSQNQGLFNTAATRMSQTQGAVSFLESASPNANLQTALSGAQSSFNNAESENAAARAALQQNLSPDQSLALIKQSLDSLSSTYQGFFTVSTLVKNSLPQ